MRDDDNEGIYESMRLDAQADHDAERRSDLRVEFEQRCEREGATGNPDLEEDVLLDMLHTATWERADWLAELYEERTGIPYEG